METNIKRDLLTALKLPGYARADYFKKVQEESGYSKEVYIKMLKEACSHYVSKIKAEEARSLNDHIMPAIEAFKERGVDTSGFAQSVELSLSLLPEIGEPGHFDKDDIHSLARTIDEAFAAEEQEPNTENKKPTAKLCLLYFYLKRNTLNKKKHLEFFNEHKLGTHGSFSNAYRELVYFINDDDRLSDREKQTFEDYNGQLHQPEKIAQLEYELKQAKK